MPKKFSVLIFGVSLILCGNVQAEESLRINLNDAINLALKNNPAIEQATEDREAAKWNLSATRRSFGPRISWTTTINRMGGPYYSSYRARRSELGKLSSEERSWYFEDTGTSYWDFPRYQSENYNSLELQWPIYTGGRLESQKKSAKYQLNYSDLALENSKQEIKWETAQAYYEALQYHYMMNVRQEELKNFYEHLETVKTQYEVGVVAMSDLLYTNVQIANSQQDLNAARASYENAISGLNNIIGLPVDTHLILDEDLNHRVYENSEEFCLNYALEHRPDGIAAKYAVKTSEESVESAKSAMRPNVSAVMNGTISGEGIFQTNHDQERWVAGVQASWSLFDNNVTSAQVNQAKSELKKAESKKKQQLDKIRLDVHNAYTNLKIAEQNIKITADAVKQAEEQYLISKVRYEEGVDINYVVIDSQEKLTKAKMNYFNALSAHNISLAQLEKAMGVPIGIDASIYEKSVDEGKKSEKALEIAKVGE